MEQDDKYDALMASIKFREEYNKLNAWGKVKVGFVCDNLLEVEDTLKGISPIRPTESTSKLLKDYSHDSTHKDS